MDGVANRRRLHGTDYWPGAARAWHRGEVSGLAMSVLFALVLNIALAASLVWRELLPLKVQWGILGGVAFWVGLSSLYSRRIRRRWEWLARHDGQLDLLLTARAEYLRGAFAAAEQSLLTLLHDQPQDVEARLMLATVYRRASRWQEAKEQLRRLQRWRDAGRWNLEIRREWELIARAACGPAADPVAKTWEFRGRRLVPRANTGNGSVDGAGEPANLGENQPDETATTITLPFPNPGTAEPWRVVEPGRWDDSQRDRAA